MKTGHCILTMGILNRTDVYIMVMMACLLLYTYIFHWRDWVADVTPWIESHVHPPPVPKVALPPSQSLSAHPPQHQQPKTNCLMAKRLARIRESCNTLQLSRNVSTRDVAHMIETDVLTNVYVGEQHKVIYCPVYKSGTTTLKTLLHKTSGANESKWFKYDLIHPSEHMKSPGIMQMNDYDTDNKVHRLDTYYSFMVVRHPFDRLLSAYKDKFGKKAQQNFAMKMQYKDIILTRFPSIAKIDKHKEIRITLDQFFELIVYEKDEFWNRHWESSISTCNPCMMRYDSVMMLETLADDIDPLLDRLTDPGGTRPELPSLRRLREDVDTYKETTMTFKNVSKDIIEGLLDIYKLDMEIFGYTWDDDTGAGSMECSHNQTC